MIIKPLKIHRFPSPSLKPAKGKGFFRGLEGKVENKAVVTQNLMNKN